VIAASLHYCRRNARSLAADLQALRRLGANAVESPVPWSVHAPAAADPAFDRDDAHLVAFLEAAAHAGLDVLLRLGPAVGADLTGLGLPPSVTADRETAARHPDGEPHVVPIPPRWILAPSYAAAAYRNRAAAWIAAAATAVRPFLAPHGPVHTLTLGDAWPYLGRNPLAAPDHHPDARAARDTSPDDPTLPERVYLDFLGKIARAAAETLGDGAPLATTLPPAALFQPVGAGLLARAFDRVGLDAYGWREHPAPLTRDALLLCGTARTPFASLVATGTPTYLPHLGPDDHLHGLRTCLAAGLPGFVLSMGVGRDRWIGGLLDENLREAEATHRHRRLLHGLGRSDWLAGRRRPVAALLVPRGAVRGTLAAAAELLGPVAPGLAAAADFAPAEALDPDDTTAAGGAWWRWLVAAEHALQELGAPYVLVDDEGPLPVETPLLLAPTTTDLAPASLERIRAQLARGGRVLCGPAAATAGDLADLPPAVPLPDAPAVAAALGDALPPTPVERLERSAFVDAAGDTVVVALVHRSTRDVPLGLALEGWPAPDAPGRGDERHAAPWRDLDEPGAARAAGTLAPGDVRFLVPAGRGSPAGREGGEP